MSIGFLPNLVLSFALISPLSGPNFSTIGVRSRVLWRILRSVRKEVEEKNEEKNPERWPLISEMAQVIFFKFGPLPSRHFCSKFDCNWTRDHRATKV